LKESVREEMNTICC